MDTQTKKIVKLAIDVAITVQVLFERLAAGLQDALDEAEGTPPIEQPPPIVVPDPEPDPPPAMPPKVFEAALPCAVRAMVHKPSLSPREEVILRGLMDGLSNKAIARQYGIADATVKVHVKAVLRKIRVQNRTQAAVWALANLPEIEDAAVLTPHPIGDTTYIEAAIGPPGE